MIQNKRFGKVNFHIERFESAMEVVRTCRERKITNPSFDDKSKATFTDWEGVSSYAEAMDLLEYGYQPTVDAMRGVFKAGAKGDGTRFSFMNDVAGFAPVVPLALMGVPKNMIAMQMKPIKAKVVDIYYDITNSCATSSEDIIKAGQELLGAVIEMERQGYRFNLYAVQSYSDNGTCDMLVVKVKSASQPLDLKRISFPLTHTAFFRVVGFDWYSRVPGGIYRMGYGHAIAFERGIDLKAMSKTLFGKNAVYFSGKEILKRSKDHIKEAVENVSSKA